MPHAVAMPEFSFCYFSLSFCAELLGSILNNNVQIPQSFSPPGTCSSSSRSLSGNLDVIVNSRGLLLEPPKPGMPDICAFSFRRPFPLFHFSSRSVFATFFLLAPCFFYSHLLASRTLSIEILKGQDTKDNKTWQRCIVPGTMTENMLHEFHLTPRHQ